MKNFLTTCVIVLTVGLAVWAYSEINTTKVTLDRVENLNQDIVLSKARLRKLNAEWAYQNRPERLEALAYEFFDELGLVTLSKDHFIPLTILPKPETDGPKLAEITIPVDVMDRGGAQ